MSDSIPIYSLDIAECFESIADNIKVKALLIIWLKKQERLVTG